jgi:NAD dependent epimerase/dehydratase family enzyme
VRALGRVLQRPAVVPLPASALELAFGKESAGQTLLASQRAVPEKLLAHGFEFQHSKLEDALRAILNDELD